jgi:hypothetical protein
VIAIFYTGDVRHNQVFAQQNHQTLFDRIKQLIEYKIYNFTREAPGRGRCPYDPPAEQADPDNAYRRGQGGAVQVWDFLRGVERTDEPYVMRLRTDLWFTPSSIDAICYEIEELLAGRSDIAYFGSDWINENAGVINRRLEINLDSDTSIQDFVVLAKRSKLKPNDEVIEDINQENNNKRRSGNKIFRYIVPTEIKDKTQTQQALVFRTLCQLWLVRQDYTFHPTDNEVCKDYIQSYILDGKRKISKKSLIDPHPMQHAVNWWRGQQGWASKQIEIGNWCAWQSQ